MLESTVNGASEKRWAVMDAASGNVKERSSRDEGMYLVSRSMQMLGMVCKADWRYAGRCNTECRGEGQ